MDSARWPDRQALVWKLLLALALVRFAAVLALAGRYGIFRDGRLVVFYSFNTDIGDGMEDPEVHNDPPEVREAALRMGVNLVVYALTN